MKKFFFILLFLVVLLISASSSSIYAVTPPIPEPKDWLGSFGGAGLVDPEVSIKEDVAPYIINLVLIGVFLASLLFLIIGGIKWSMGGGTKDGIGKAKATITYALVGLVLSFLAFVIFKVLQSFLGATVI